MRFLLFLAFASTVLSLSGFSQQAWMGVIQGGSERTWSNYPDVDSRQKALDSLLIQARRSGFLGAYSIKERSSEDSIWVELILGPKIDRIILSSGNVPPVFLQDQILGSKDLLQVNELMQVVLDRSENSGYPFASIRLDSIQRKISGLVASLYWESGPLITWDSLEVSAQNKTSQKYLQRLSGIIPGDIFSQKQLDAAIKIFNRSPYFRVVGEPELSFQIRKAKASFNLAERDANTLDGIIGFLPNQNEPGKLLITGQLDLNLVHLGGKGRDIAVQWQRFNELTENLHIEAKESFVFNSPLDVGGQFSLLKQDSTFIKRELGLRFGYRSGPDLYFRFFANRVASDLLATFAYQEALELPEVADFRWSEYGAGIEWNRLNDAAAPRRGAKASLIASVGNKRIIQNTGLPEGIYEDLELNTPQYAAALKWEKHLFLKPSWGMYLGGAGALIRNENLLLNDLYRLGGLKSIRGFNENFFFASSYAYLNFEQRLFFGENSFLLVFLDAGIIENPYFAESIDKPISLGSGLNFETGSGVFRFIYAVGKSTQQAFSFAQSKIHFGYLARF